MDGAERARVSSIAVSMEVLRMSAPPWLVGPIDVYGGSSRLWLPRWCWLIPPPKDPRP